MMAKRKDTLEKQTKESKISVNEKKGTTVIPANKKPSHEAIPTAYQYDQAKIANLIAAVAVGVSIVLAIFTYSLFRQASTQTQVANKSANAAVTADSIANNSYHLSDSIYKATDSSGKVTLAQTKAYNDNFLKTQRDQFDENKKESNSREEREKRQFEIENKPFLQTIDIRIDTMIHGKQLQLSFAYFNYGKLPANIIFSKTGINYSIYSNFTETDSLINYAETKTNFYIANGISQRMTASKIDTLPQSFINQYNSGKIYLFLYGFCEYINPVTGKKTIYKFKNRISTKPFFRIDVLENSINEPNNIK